MTTSSTFNRPASLENVSISSLKQTLGSFASGVNLITAHDEQGPVGFTCQSFYSVSLDPPLISLSVMHSSTSYPRIRRTGGFAVNVLCESQKTLSNQFAKSSNDKWAGVKWEFSPTGKPLIDGSMMWLECSLYSEQVVGDHYVVYGEVQEAKCNVLADDGPLIYFKGGYRSLAGT